MPVATSILKKTPQDLEKIISTFPASWSHTIQMLRKCQDTLDSNGFCCILLDEFKAAYTNDLNEIK
jgi:hypothetical protein